MSILCCLKWQCTTITPFFWAFWALFLKKWCVINFHPPGQIRATSHEFSPQMVVKSKGEISLFQRNKTLGWWNHFGQNPPFFRGVFCRDSSTLGLPWRRTWETGNSSPLPLCAEVAWDIDPPESLPCPYHRRGRGDVLKVVGVCISSYI